MGANTRVFLEVLRTHSEWIEVSALHLDEAKDIAMREPGVIQVLQSQYDYPEGEDYVLEV